MGAMMVRFGDWVKANIVLVVSAVIATVTVVLVPPDVHYLGYVDWDTLACLFGILALVEALRNQGVFQRVAQSFVKHFRTCRSALFAIVAATLVISMVATNDMALVMMLPLAAVLVSEGGWTNKLPFLFVMQSLAANLGGMIVPFGNPQNLYLYSRFSITLPDFLGTMALPFAVSVALIVACCLIFLRPDPIARTDREPTARLGSPRPDGKRVVAYALLLVLVLGAVFRAVPALAALAVVVLALLVLDRRALSAIDFGLLCTFICFFVFAGNMARIPAVEALLGACMAQSALLTAALSSQIISNVPAAILLAQFADGWRELLVGVNVGGAGTLVASLANLITFNQYRLWVARSPFDHLTIGRFFAWFFGLNFAFLAVLLAVCLLAFAGH